MMTPSNLKYDQTISKVIYKYLTSNIFSYFFSSWREKNGNKDLKVFHLATEYSYHLVFSP